MEKTTACGDQTDVLEEESPVNNEQKSNDVVNSVSNCLDAGLASENGNYKSETQCDHLKTEILDERLSSERETSPTYDDVDNSEWCDIKYENGDIHIDRAEEAQELTKDSEPLTNKHSLFALKRKKILKALKCHDITFLRSAAMTEGGLLSDDIRRKVWPKLVGVDIVSVSPRPTTEEIENHHYYRQVVLDVNRSLKRFPPSIKESEKLAMLDQLVLLIMRVLCKHPQLHYYQGYHDICITFLLVLGEELAYHVVEKLSRTHLGVFMMKSMDETLLLLNCMFPLIDKKSQQLSKFLLKSEVGVAYCVSWLITWFGHVLNDYDTVVRLFDFFLVSHYSMPLYLTSAIVLYREEEVLRQDCDMASVHSLLSDIPDDLPFEDLLIDSLELFNKYDIKQLKKESDYLTERRPKIRHKASLLQSIANRIKSSVPAPYFTVPFVIAAAVLGIAILYQAYEY